MGAPKDPKKRAEWIKNISNTLKGNIPWNKNIKIDRNKYPTMGHFQKHTPEAKEKQRKSHLGVPLSEMHRKNIGLSLIGRKPWHAGLTKETDERVRQMSITLTGQRGWNKGLTKETDSRIHSAWNKNVPQKEEVKEKIKRTVIKKYQDDKDYTNRVSKGTLKAMQRPDVKKKLLEQPERKFPFSNTSIEIKIQNILKENSISFETQKRIEGRPDIFIEPNICIFCDGDYWHNRPRSHERDAYVNKTLKEQGYQILRFWEHEINESIEYCINIIKKYI